MTSGAARSREDLVRLFSRAASTYDTVGPRFFTYFAQRLVARASPAPGADVLDVATGTGAVLLEAAEHVGSEGRVVGVDLTPAMLHRAADEAERRALHQVELRLMDAERLDFEDGSFDYVFCAFALPMLSDPAAALKAFCRVLRPGGRLGLANAFGWFHQHDERWHRVGAILRSFGVEDAAAAPSLGRAELERLLAGAGFADVHGAEETFALAFADGEEWWAWAASHAYRQLLEAVPRQRLGPLKRALVHDVEARRAHDGRIHGSISARLTCARRRR